MPRLTALLSDDEIAEINDFYDDSRGRHPAWSAMHAFDQQVQYTRSCKDYLVNQSVDVIMLKDGAPAWLSSIVKRVAQTTDFEDTVAALAEIRCYGAMSEAGFRIRSIPTTKTPTPDFEFDLGGTGGVIEVAAKLEHGDQLVRARQIANGETPEGVERFTEHGPRGRIDFTASEVHPFDAPDPNKPGETTQTHAISKICSIKAKETQVANQEPSLLWIDFRDLGRWPRVLQKEQCAPLVCGHYGTLCSGAIWYAFYGWKDAPVFDDHIGGGQSITPMAHFGRFARGAPATSRYSAAILCLAEAPILFENPTAKTPLTGAQRAALTRLPWFNLTYSVADWHQGDVDRAHTLAQTMIEALHKDRSNV